MRILFLSLYPPYPPNDGGRIRIFNILKQVAFRHHVTLVCFDSPLSGEEDLNVLRQWCERTIVVPRPVPQSRTWIKKILDLPQRMPIGSSHWRSPQMAETLSRLVGSESFHLAHIDHIALAQYADALWPLPQVLTHHNVEGLLQQRQLKVAGHQSCFRQWASRLENRRWIRYEIEASRRAGVVVTVSEIDAQYFHKYMPQTPVFVVPNGVDTGYFQPGSRNERDDMNLLFTGQMDYAPNVDAMEWFCKEAFPLIRRVKPDVRLLIVGRDPAPDIVSLSEIEGVTVTGRVEDVRPFHQHAAVFVVPLRFGGGTRLKILEAMAMGKAIVTTSIGCEGLELDPGSELLVADAPADFAEAVLRLLDDKCLRQDLGRRARQTVVTNYDWLIIGEKQLQAYEAAVMQHAKQQRRKPVP
jgi:sugar transferase (PEP-CTERM/EpsH1 system associated)